MRWKKRVVYFILFSFLREIHKQYSFNLGREGNYLTLYQGSRIDPHLYQFTLVERTSNHVLCNRSDSLGNHLHRECCIKIWDYLKAKWRWLIFMVETMVCVTISKSDNPGSGNSLLIISMFSSWFVQSYSVHGLREIQYE